MTHIVFKKPVNKTKELKLNFDCEAISTGSIWSVLNNKELMSHYRLFQICVTLSAEIKRGVTFKNFAVCMDSSQRHISTLFTRCIIFLDLTISPDLIFWLKWKFNKFYISSLLSFDFWFVFYFPNVIYPFPLTLSILTLQARNYEFYRAEEDFSWNKGTSINIHLQHEKERSRKEKNLRFVRLETLKKFILNEKLYP